MANWQVISLDTTTPQLRAPGTGDGYSFNSGSTQLGVWTTTGLGVGTASPSNRLDVIQTAGGFTGIRTNSQSAAQNSDSGLRLVANCATVHTNWLLAAQYNAGGFEITPSTAAGGGTFSTPAFFVSTTSNVGIGTTSPGYKLTIDNSAGDYYPIALTSGAIGTAGNFVGMRFGFTGTTYQKAAIIYQSADANGRGTMHFCLDANANSANADVADSKLQLDYSGNLGLGVTPSAWDTSIFRALQVGSGAGSAALFGRTDNANNAGLSVNYYYGAGNYRYLANGYASYYNQQNGVHSWHIAPSNTSGAGAIASFTQAMTLDASGNLGIGTTNPITKLQVNAAAPTIRVEETTTGGFKRLEMGVTSAGLAFISAPQSAQDLTFNTTGTERARIDSVGRLLVGGTSAVYASNNGAIEVQNTSGAILNAGRFAANTGGPTLSLLKSRNATVGGNTIVVDGDTLGDVSFVGANGTGYDEAARIRASVDGTPGASADMPGRLTFWTSADGSATPTERMRISNAGNVVVNTAAVATTATDGFLYIPTCAGAPTGVPTTFTGRSPLVVDSTNNRFYVYVNGAWKYATLT